MAEDKHITIIGGGIAGLSLGIALRQHNVPVTIWDAGKFPRHRVCGEFICGKGRNILARLELLEKLTIRGARSAQTAAFYAGELSQCVTLPEPGLCCSRFLLDQLLAQEFRNLDGELHEQKRHPVNKAEGMVVTTGRRMLSSAKGSWRWLGLKAHARQVKPMADVEIHLAPNSYVGLCEVENGVTNVCGLFRSREPWTDLAERWPDCLRGVQESVLFQRTHQALFNPESFCSVTALDFRPSHRTGEDGCRLGDAFAVIAPIAGNGISIALESAELAHEPLIGYSSGYLCWHDAVKQIQYRLHRAFSSRLWIAWLIQTALFQPNLRRWILKLLWRHPGSIQFLAKHTR